MTFFKTSSVRVCPSSSLTYGCIAVMNADADTYPSFSNHSPSSVDNMRIPLDMNWLMFLATVHLVFHLIDAFFAPLVALGPLSICKQSSFSTARSSRKSSSFIAI